MQACSNEAVDDSRVRTAGSSVFGESEAIDHRKSRYQDPDSDSLDRVCDGSPIAALCPQKTASVRGQQNWKKTGPIHCRRMAT